MLRTDRLFPCVFGSDAVRSGALRYAFVPAGEGRVEALADVLRVYTTMAESSGRRTSLVCFFEHDPRLSGPDTCEEHFWELLRGLREWDESLWPEEISTDTEAPDREFVFNFTPIFAVANTPFHYKRRSRFFECFAVTFQARFVFDDLAAGTRVGGNARKVIRKRLTEYDEFPCIPFLGNFAEHGSKEWHQYFLDEENEVPTPRTGAPCTDPPTPFLSDTSIRRPHAPDPPSPPDQHLPSSICARTCSRSRAASKSSTINPARPMTGIGTASTRLSRSSAGPPSCSGGRTVSPAGSIAVPGPGSPCRPTPNTAPPPAPKAVCT